MKLPLIKTGSFPDRPNKFLYMTYELYKEAPYKRTWPLKLSRIQEIILFIINPAIKLNNFITIKLA